MGALQNLYSSPAMEVTSSLEQIAQSAPYIWQSCYIQIKSENTLISKMILFP